MPSVVNIHTGYQCDTDKRYGLTILSLKLCTVDTDVIK